MVNKTNTAASETAHGERPCTNPICVSGVVYGDDESGDCGSCGGTGILRCACEGGPATVDTIDVRTGKAIVCCAACDAEELAYQATAAKEVA